MKGGCTFASLSIFESFCAVSKSSDFYEKLGRGHPFYNFCVRPQYWLTGLSTKVEIEHEVGGKFRRWEYGQDPYVDSEDEGRGESGSQTGQSLTSSSNSEAKSQSDSECEDQDGEASQEDVNKGGDLDSQAGSLPLKLEVDGHENHK